MNDLISVLRAFHGLATLDEWRELPGVPESLVLIHTWPDESVDTLTVHNETHAFAQRTNPGGTPVWNRIGAVTAVIEALRQLPPPSDPDAPHELLGTPSRDRDLGPS